MGILFRTSLLLNGILFNTEALFSLSDSHIESLEECDKYLMRQLFNVKISAPIESLFIESSTIRQVYSKGSEINVLLVYTSQK